MKIPVGIGLSIDISIAGEDTPRVYAAVGINKHNSGVSKLRQMFCTKSAYFIQCKTAYVKSVLQLPKLFLILQYNSKTTAERFIINHFVVLCCMEHALLLCNKRNELQE